MKEPVLDSRFLTGKNRWQPPDYEWLYDQYITLRKSKLLIAEETGCARATLKSWLRLREIPIRTMAQASQARDETGARQVPTGPKSPWWGGDAVGVSAQGYRARRVLSQAGVPKVCEWCGKNKKRIQVNHQDHDVSNNSLSNLQYLCSRCHRLETILWNMYEDNEIDLPLYDDKLVVQDGDITITFLN